MQILTRNECASFFHPSPPSTRPHLSMKSLGTTTFSNAERSDPPPTLIDVMLVVGAVSKAREEYHCQESDSPIPDITIAGFDARMERIAWDQDKIRHHYKELDSRWVEALNQKAIMEGALQRADDAERVSRENKEARVVAEARNAQERAERGARIAAEDARMAAEAKERAERGARIAAEARERAAEERAANLEAQLRNLGLSTTNA
ncbi:hypothetical protein BS47DRAFT_1350986 [Hydnum rufescens UP504]|uniref:Uncharacterized protein n=1 Tax=Hydnum rufescens UP504 TaxID=1448309 RepID=A0A9P6ALB2_9AGAM|nr:hypothetical protein BS47DRAFT_1350986 [Hydnum rufescens UP504]